MSGYSRTDSRCSDISPKITSSRLMTVAKTGRRTETSKRSIRARLLRGIVTRDVHLVPVAEVLRAFDDDALPFRQRVGHLDLARTPLADTHLAALGALVRHDEDVRAALLGDDRLLRDDERRHVVAFDANGHEHAGSQQP